MSKNIKITLGLGIGLLAILGFMYGPKYLRAMEIAEKMEMEYIEDVFINMDEYFDKTEVQKAPTPFIYPQEKNIQLPESFTAKGQVFNTMEYLDSSYTQGLSLIHI